MADEPNLRASRLRIDGPVAELSHARGNVRNPMSEELRRDYGEVLDLIDARPELRVLVITGSAGSFCAGGDIRRMQQRLHDGRGPEEMHQRMQRANRLLHRLRELELPLIAAIDGPAYGAGFGLALMADFVLASTRATFSASFARLGAIPDFGLLYTLPRRVGMARAKEIVLSARRIDVHEAQDLGLAYAVHEPEQLLPAAHALARKLCDGPREAAGMTRRLLDQSFETDFGTMCQLEAQAQAIAMHTPYHIDAVARFVERRPLRLDWDAPAPAPAKEP